MADPSAPAMHSAVSVRIGIVHGRRYVVGLVLSLVETTYSRIDLIVGTS